MKSIWNNTPLPKFEMLTENKNTDVLIVGGGIAGILTAYKLKNAGVDCTLIEADKICGGITKNTTAKITFCHALLYDKLIKKYGKQMAKQYIDAQILACNEYADICKNIDCDYEQKDSYVYSLNNKKIIEKEILALNSLGVNAMYSDVSALPFKVCGAVRVEKQAQFHPLKFLYVISKDLPVYENTKAIQFFNNKVVTNHAVINFNKLIIATHFPILNKHGAYFIKMYQHRSYVIALKDARYVNGMYVDCSDSGLSFRNYKDLLLLGGGGHRTGKQGGGWKNLEDFAKKYYKDAKIVCRWATQDCMTLDRAAYIGQYSKNTPNIFVATGFNKWGMSNAMAGANILCDIVMGKQNRYSDIFSPTRSILHRQLAVNTFESALGLITPTVPRCPHLGCALKYNKAEHSWDCSCHGSRFSQNGELIDNPATDDHQGIGR